MQIGFLGLGQMGSAIAERLQDAGADLHVFDPNEAAIAPFVARGAHAHASATGGGGRGARLFSPACQAGRSANRWRGDVAAGQCGASLRGDVHHRRPGAGEGRRRLWRRAGSRWWIARSAAGPKGARAGTLTVIIAGPPDAREMLRPWLQRIGKSVFEVGDKPGQAQLMKLVNNLVNAANMATAFEALVLGAKGGLDPDQMVNVLNVSTGQNSATLTKVPKAVLTGSSTTASSLTIMLKDVVLGLQEAEALGVPMWVHGTVGQLVAVRRTAGPGAGGFHLADQGAGRLGGSGGSE